MNEPNMGFSLVPRGTKFTMRLADIVTGLKKGGRKSGLTPEREATLRTAMEMAAKYSCKTLAAKWGVSVERVEAWRQIVRKRMVSK